MTDAIPTAAATRIQHLILRWMILRRARRSALAAHLAGSLRTSPAVATLTGLTAGLFALMHGLLWEVALSAVLLAPLLAEHLPRRLDARARRQAHIGEGEAAACYLQRLTTLDRPVPVREDGEEHAHRAPEKVAEATSSRSLDRVVVRVRMSSTPSGKSQCFLRSGGAEASVSVAVWTAGDGDLRACTGGRRCGSTAAAWCR